ncbi:uncharacterized protein LOC134705516 [Mytilus trossulus]|uniref:uncharacterized protein LOC134705516 n=1 Tax=Mytilus trossulus TaxID=6551 RepID=UPI003005B7E2
MHLNVIFNKTSNDEYGFCLLPFPTPKCVSKYNNTLLHQDITKNQTILTIKSSEDKILNGVWICSYGSTVVNVSVTMKTAFDVGEHVKHSGTILKVTIEGAKLTLICKVDILESYITIINPNGLVVGKCLPPPYNRSFGVCTNNLEQFLDSNRTIMTLNMSINENLGGTWICAHGSNESKDTIYVAEQSTFGASLKTGPNEQKYKTLLIIFCVITSVPLIAASIYFMKKRHTSIFRKKNPEENIGFVNEFE